MDEFHFNDPLNKSIPENQPFPPQNSWNGSETESQNQENISFPNSSPYFYNGNTQNATPPYQYQQQPNDYGYFSYNNQPFYPNTPPPKRKKRTRAFLWSCAVLMLAAAVALIIIGMSYRPRDITWIFQDDDDDKKIPFNSYEESSYSTKIELPEAPKAAADLNGPQISVSETSHSEVSNAANRAYENASPSIVCITSYKAGTDYALTQSGEGSGIIITDDGYIATNSHVVDDSKETGVMITLSDGTQYLGTVIGIDKKTDLAVIKIDADNLKAAQFFDSDSLYVGQDAYAIGNPGGSKFSNSLTKGTVSALNRIVSTGYVKYIQTDAAINPGNSGGALINEDGQVIGMNTIKLVGTDYEGMGFAIPSNQVIEIINKLIKYGYVNDRGTLGIEGTNCTLYQSRMNNVPQGVVITKINSDSPLSDSEVMEKDIITAINGISITNFTEFIDELSKFKPNDTITLTLFRVPNVRNAKPYSFTVSVQLMDDSGA